MNRSGCGPLLIFVALFVAAIAAVVLAGRGALQLDDPAPTPSSSVEVTRR